MRGLTASDGSIISYDYGIERRHTPTAIQAAAVRIQVKLRWKRPRRLLYPMPVLQVPMLLRWRENWIGMMACLFMSIEFRNLEAMSTAMKLKRSHRIDCRIR